MVLYALTLSKANYITALRECSIVFGAILGVIHVERELQLYYDHWYNQHSFWFGYDKICVMKFFTSGPPCKRYFVLAERQCIYYE